MKIEIVPLVCPQRIGRWVNGCQLCSTPGVLGKYMFLTLINQAPVGLASVDVVCATCGVTFTAPIMLHTEAEAFQFARSREKILYEWEDVEKEGFMPLVYVPDEIVVIISNCLSLRAQILQSIS